MISEFHKSVLLQEVLESLNVCTGKKYIDATLGGGGHTKAILAEGGLVLAIDQDQDAIEYVQKTVKNNHLLTVKGNFSDLIVLAKKNNFYPIAGILFDLGISSHQVGEAQRGFSFLRDASLDMRMDRSTQVSAKDLVNGLHKGELIELFQRYGEEPFAKRIAEQIVEERKIKPIETTTQLAALVSKCYSHRMNKIHPATKIFQALRIAVNDELYNIKIALPQAEELLEPEGRIAVISFHSLEDRIVKRTFAEFEEKGYGKIVTKKPIEPSLKELNENLRSRSSKLRVFQKL